MKQHNSTARDRKIARRLGRNHPVNGRSMKRLLVDRAAKAQAPKPTRKCWSCGEMEPIQTACQTYVESLSTDRYEVQP